MIAIRTAVTYVPGNLLSTASSCLLGFHASATICYNLLNAMPRMGKRSISDICSCYCDVSVEKASLLSFTVCVTRTAKGGVATTRIGKQSGRLVQRPACHDVSTLGP